MEDHHKTRLQSLIDLHNDFARAYKIVEPLVQKMDVTTLNDIRYALRAMMDCIQVSMNEDASQAHFDEAFSRAELALRTAWNDVVDITFDSFDIYIDKLGKEYGPDIVAKYIDISEYAEIQDSVDDLTEESRGDRTNRPDYYEKITREHLKSIKRVFKKAKRIEPAIAGARKKEKFRHGMIIFGGICTIIVATTIVYVNFFRPDDCCENPVPPQQENQIVP